MLKVLIADDEKKVCQLIVNLIDWEAYGFQVVGVVNDGMELIQKAKVFYPELRTVEG